MILFIAAVWGIEELDSVEKKLGALTWSVLFFSIVVVMLNQAGIMEAITVTAAYAAVLIVLVGKG